MNIYEFEYTDGQCDWVFAPTKVDAIVFYKNFTECYGDEYKIKRIPKSKWGSHYILDVDGYCDDVPEDEEDNYVAGYKIEMTFKEYAEKNTQTDIICTTEF